MLGCHGNPEKPVGDGSFLRFRWARLPHSVLVHATPQFPPPPPVTPTLAQVNSFNIEYKSGTCDLYTCCAAVRHATSVCSPYIDASRRLEFGPTAVGLWSIWKREVPVTEVALLNSWVAPVVRQLWSGLHYIACVPYGALYKFVQFFLNQKPCLNSIPCSSYDLRWNICLSYFACACKLLCIGVKID
jgi:hypothetical protein